MRDIKFRAKDIHNVWCYGYYIDGGNKAYLAVSMIHNGHGQMIRDAYSSGYIIDVIPETVGQFTGLKDKNGKEIYEGDIVKYNERSGEYIEQVLWDNFCCKFITRGKDGRSHDIFQSDSDNFEVISNIHENPELLEAKK